MCYVNCNLRSECMHKKAAVVILSTAIAKVYLREPDRFTFSQKSVQN